jgi:hypothetical protein
MCKQCCDCCSHVLTSGDEVWGSPALPSAYTATNHNAPSASACLPACSAPPAPYTTFDYYALASVAEVKCGEGLVISNIVNPRFGNLGSNCNSTRSYRQASGGACKQGGARHVQLHNRAVSQPIFLQASSQHLRCGVATCLGMPRHSS